MSPQEEAMNEAGDLGERELSGWSTWMSRWKLVNSWLFNQPPLTYPPQK